MIMDARASADGWYSAKVLCFSTIGLASNSDIISSKDENALNNTAKNIAAER